MTWAQARAKANTEIPGCARNDERKTGKGEMRGALHHGGKGAAFGRDDGGWG
jgi:hypothetical protein